MWLQVQYILDNAGAMEALLKYDYKDEKGGDLLPCTHTLRQ